MIKYVYTKIKSFNNRRLILILLFLLAYSIYTFSDLQNSITGNIVTVSFFDVLFRQLNNKTTITIVYTITLLFFIGDTSLNSKWEMLLSFRLYKRYKWAMANVIYIFIMCIILMVFIILMNTIVSIGRVNYSNDWINIRYIEKIAYMTPLSALGLSVIFVFLRLFVFSLMIYFINLFLHSKNLSFIIIIVLTIIVENSFYDIVRISPFGILPYENTLLTYSGTSYYAEGIRISYTFSLIYWAVLLAAVVTGIIYFANYYNLNQNNS